MSLAESVARLIAERGEVHWTVVLDDALKSGAVPPTPDARKEVLRALAEAEREGTIVKTSTGTYTAP